MSSTSASIASPSSAASALATDLNGPTIDAPCLSRKDARSAAIMYSSSTRRMRRSARSAIRRTLQGDCDAAADAIGLELQLGLRTQLIRQGALDQFPSVAGAARHALRHRHAAFLPFDLGDLLGVAPIDLPVHGESTAFLCKCAVLHGICHELVESESQRLGSGGRQGECRTVERHPSRIELTAIVRLQFGDQKVAQIEAL